jgi:hypothetical protein
MQLTVTISDEIMRKAEARWLPLADFVDLLIDNGLVEVRERNTVSSAIKRIRALRTPPPAFGRR